MTTFLIVIHVIVCIALIGLVLIQRGRGAGLVESFAGVESMFGTKTNAFLTRTTTVLSVAFFITCLVLAVVSVRQSKSLMGKIKTQAPVTQPATVPQIPATTSSSIPVTSPVTQPTQDAPKTN
jgi:preprotein translocase subunit SecG